MVQMLNLQQHHRHHRVAHNSNKDMLRGGLQPIGRLARQRSRLILTNVQNHEQQQTLTTTAAADKAAQASKQWAEASSIYYSNYPLDRAADARRDEPQVTAWFNSPNARVTPVNGSRILVTELPPSAAAAAVSPTNGNGASSSNKGSITGIDCSESPTLQPVWVSPASDLACTLNPAVPPLFLGIDYASKTPHFAVQVTPADVEPLAHSYAARWVNARNAGPELSRSDAALMAVASGLAQWNLDAQYHGTSGSQTVPADGGFSRKCSSSGRSMYPRLDPAIITLVTAGDEWCLLGRKHGWPAGRYSTLAGFLEIGETLEQALAREVLEESGVAVDLHSVRYVASQPWPFPRSLMVGFYAAAAAITGPSSSSSSNNAAVVELLPHEARMAMMDSGITAAEVAAALRGCLQLQPPTPQEGEMEDVRWFHRDWLTWALQQGPGTAPGGFMIPGQYSLAYKLITGWLQNPQQQQQQQQQQQHSPGPSTTDSSSSSSAWIGDQVPQVEIDTGVFKYVLLRLVDSTTGDSKLLVRGAAAAAYHNHILQHTKAQLQQLLPNGQLKVEVLGGGRIEHYPEQQVISVYGYSAAFGPAVHEVTVALLRKWFPFYDQGSITCSYEGY